MDYPQGKLCFSVVMLNQSVIEIILFPWKNVCVLCLSDMWERRLGRSAPRAGPEDVLRAFSYIYIYIDIYRIRSVMCCSVKVSLMVSLWRWSD